MNHRIEIIGGSLAFGLLALAGPPAFAAASLTIVPISWNVVGLDSNNVGVGPNTFPVGGRVCNVGDAPATNVSSAFLWDSANANVNLRPGTLSDFGSSPVDSLAPAACHDFYYEIEVTRTAAAYGTTRRYHLTAVADALPAVSTPTPREIYVEHLISQARNQLLDVKLDGNSVPAGGTMTLVVGRTYTIELVAATATNGYEQLQTFINFPNTVFQTLAVSTTYTADSSVPVGNPNDKLYGDACTWENDPNSPHYRSCRGVGKVGGDIVVTYAVKILEVPEAPLANPQPLGSLVYDFSGSSFHYNADYGVAARFAAVVDPATLTLDKNFGPDPTSAGGVSALTFTLTNPNPAAISGLSFADTLPLSPGAMVVANPPAATTNGCGAPVFAPVAGSGSLSFSGGSVAANSSCTVKVNVTVPVTGSYTNTSGELFAGAIGTGSFATDTLTANGSPPPPAPVCGLALATWNFASGFALAAPAPYAPGTSVAASASIGAGLVSQQSAQNHTVAPAGTVSWGSNGGFDSSGALNTAFNDYFQLAVDTTGLTSVDLSFWARRPIGNSPQQVLVYYGTSASPPGVLHTTLGSPPGTPFPAAQNSWQSSGTLTFGSGLNPAGPTYFRIYGAHAGNNNPGADLYLDDILFTGCGVAPPPSLSKSFSPSPVAVGGSSTLSFTLANSSSVAATGVGFGDTLPAGLTVTSGVSSQCGGTLTLTAPGTLSFSGGTLAASSSCTVTATVTAATAGPHDNVSGFVSGTEGGTNSGASGLGAASLTGILPPSIAKHFAANPILAGTVSTLTFTISNPNASLPLSGVAFADSLPGSPGAMVVAAAPAAATSGCGAPTFAPAAGATAISFSGGTVAGGGTCIVTVNVTAPVAGSYANTSGNVSHLVGGSPVSGGTASSTLVATPATPQIALLKQVGPSLAGPWGSFLALPAGGSVFYRFTLENLGNVPLTALGVTDPMVSAASCVWPSTLPVGTPTTDPTATCVVGPVGAATGVHANTATGSGSFGGNGVTDSSTATYATTGLSIAKSVLETSFSMAGDVLHYTFVVTNSGAAILESPLAVADDRATDEACPPLASVPDFDNFLDPGESVACTATYVVTSGDVGLGSVTNLASASAPGATSNTDSETVTLAGGPSATGIAKSFAPDPIAVGGVSTLTFTLTNPNAGLALTGVAFSDPLPAGLEVAATPSVTLGGCGSPVFAPGEGATSLSFSGGTIAAAGTCTVTVDVTATTSGLKSNVTSNVTSSNGGTGNTGADTLAVLAPPSLAKAFDPSAIAVGGVSTLTFTVTNPNAGNALTGVAFADPLPAGLAVAAAPNATTSLCGSPVFAPAAGATRLSFTAGSIAAAGTCTVTVDVVGTSGGVANNTTGIVSSANGGAGNTASASITVGSAPGIAKSFAPDPIAVGGVSTLTFTLTNPNAGLALAGVAFSDPLPAGLEVAAAPNATLGGCGSPVFAPGAGATTLVFSGGTLAAAGTCTVTVDVTATTSGLKSNVTSNVTSSNGGTGNTGADTLAVLAPPSLAKAFDPSAIAVGGVSTLTFTVTNPNAGSALTGVAFIDGLPTGMQVAPTPNAGFAGCGAPAFTPAPAATTLSFAGGTIAGGGTCSATVDVVATLPGSLLNTTGNVTSANGGSGNTASGTLVVGPGAAPLVGATKTSTFDLQTNDLDGSLSLSPGDTLLYTIEIVNTGGGDALAVVLTDTPDANTSLVILSVATSQGSVILGNNPGDTSVAVDLGNLAATTGQATVTFSVRLADPFPAGAFTIANQGSVHGGNFPDLPTDDPSTVGVPGDPTVDVVDVRGAAAIPTLSSLGLLLFALALAALAIGAIRGPFAL